MIKEFANYLSLNVWDWFAVLIAMFSLATAIASFIIAKRTLRSQEQTERNTTPSINHGSQYESLVSIVIQLLDNYISSFLMNYRADRMKGNEDFSNMLLLSSKINVNDIHVELFYDKGIPWSELEKKWKLQYNYEYNYADRSQYRLFADFRNHVENYNRFCNLLELQYVNNSNKRSLIAKEYASYLKNETMDLLRHIVSTSNMIFPEYDLRTAIQRYLIDSKDKYTYLYELKHHDTSNIEEYDERLYFVELIDYTSWKSLFDTYKPKYNYELTVEELKNSIADIAYYIFKDGWQKDYYIM